MILLLRWFTALHMYKRLSQYAGRLESSTTFQGATDLLCPLTDVTYVEEVKHLVSVIFNCCPVWVMLFSDAGTSSLWSLWSHWRATPAPGVPIPASSSCYDRFGPQGNWLFQSGSLDGGGNWSWCNGWCEFSFKALEHKLRYNFSQLSALKWKSLCPSPFNYESNGKMLVV